MEDIGFLPVSDQAAEALYRVVEACYERTLVALSSNLYPAFTDMLMLKTLYTSSVDRLLHHAYLVQIARDSLRTAQALSTTIIRT